MTEQELHDIETELDKWNEFLAWYGDKQGDPAYEQGYVIHATMASEIALKVPDLIDEIRRLRKGGAK